MSELNNSFSTKTHLSLEEDENNNDMVNVAHVSVDRNADATSEEVVSDYSENDNYIETLNVFLHSYCSIANGNYAERWNEIGNACELEEQDSEYEDEHLKSVSNFLHHSKYESLENRRRFNNFLSMSFHNRGRQIEELCVKLDCDEEDLASLLSNASGNNSLRNESYHNLLDMLDQIPTIHIKGKDCNKIIQNTNRSDRNSESFKMNCLINEFHALNNNQHTKIKRLHKKVKKIKTPKIDITCRDNKFLGNKRDRDPDDKDPEGSVDGKNKKLLNRLTPFYKLQITHQINAKQK
jgi:hypothetical protein